jgi:hypothetical protein
MVLGTTRGLDTETDWPTDVGRNLSLNLTSLRTSRESQKQSRMWGHLELWIRCETAAEKHIFGIRYQATASEDGLEGQYELIVRTTVQQESAIEYHVIKFIEISSKWPYFVIAQVWALPEKPPVVQILNNIQKFHGSRRFVTVFTRSLHWSLSWVRSIQSIPPHFYL